MLVMLEFACMGLCLDLLGCYWHVVLRRLVPELIGLQQLICCGFLVLSVTEVLFLLQLCDVVLPLGWGFEVGLRGCLEDGVFVYCS